MRRVAWIICLSVVFFSATSSGEFYRYVDKDGNVHFTDDYALVPENQRKGLQPYTEFEKKDETKSDESVKKAPSSPPTVQAPDLSPESVSDANKTLDETKKRLDAMGQELDVEYRNLIQERQALQEAQKKASKNAIKAVNKKILELNKKVEDFKVRQSAYNKAVEGYNADILKRNAGVKEAADTPTPVQP